MMTATTIPLDYASKAAYEDTITDTEILLPRYIGGTAVPVDEPYERPEELPDELPAVEPRRRAAVRERQGQSVSALGVVGAAAAAVLLTLVLLAHVRLNAISYETVKLQSQLTELQAQEAKLLVQYENTFNLNEIEDYAINNLGMRHPTEDQITHLNSSRADKAVVLGEAETTISEAVGGFREFVMSLLEYLK